MPLPTPNLDDRTFQDILNEALRKIPQYCEEWTDHNLSDPGITLIELFAWMMEQTLYRLNRVPDKNYIKFLELIGLRLLPTNPAGTELTFWLTAPRPTPVFIPRGTQVATVRTETQDAITFTTDQDLVVAPAGLDYLLVSFDGTRFDDRMPAIREWEALAGAIPLAGRERSPFATVGGQSPLPPASAVPGFNLFEPTPQPGNALYLGFQEDLRGVVLSLTMDLDEKAGLGVNPNNPPVQWEYWDAPQSLWLPFERNPDALAWWEKDTTLGLNKYGEVALHIPRSAGTCQVALREAYWLRCVVVPAEARRPAYQTSPRLKGVRSAAVGGRVPATNAVTVVNEVLGRSNGRPGQVFKVSQGPMLVLGPGERIEVERAPGDWRPWDLVSDFSQASPRDECFVCDTALGEISFGPNIRMADGTERQNGAIPPEGKLIRLSAYRYGGGRKGNVGRGTINVPKAAIPFVARVTNRRSAVGGLDPESIENAKLRGPQMIRTRHRAVTAEDYEYLAREAFPGVARVRCIQPGQIGDKGRPPPGVVRLHIVPSVTMQGERVYPDQLALSPEIREAVQRYLNERRLLTTLLVVSTPVFLWVSVEARVHIGERYSAPQVEGEILKGLYRFLNPLVGGPEGEGWPFGRDLFISDAYAHIQRVDGVEYVEELKMYLVDQSTRERKDAGVRLHVSEDALVCSGEHVITVIT